MRSLRSDVLGLSEMSMLLILVIVVLLVIGLIAGGIIVVVGLFFGGLLGIGLFFILLALGAFAAVAFLHIKQAYLVGIGLLLLGVALMVAGGLGL